ncbi:MAG: J domain-containing protein [Treponema sp.]|jgi:DnaJ-domain-containing protein 1|nr:J domain-containing protein [Treponema sp.]
MGMWDRLGDIIKSYLNEEDAGLFADRGGRAFSADPDVAAAYEELDDFLSGRERRRGGDRPGETGQGGASKAAIPPQSLRADFAELELPFGASGEECKSAYKRLLKIHHPDRHAGHEGNMKKATEKSARINTAFERIEKWRSTQ